MASNVTNSDEELAEKHSSDLLLLDNTDSINIVRSVCHSCPSDFTIKERDKRRLIIASIVCVVLMIAGIICGILSNSLAIASDAAHLLTDFGAFMVSLTAIWISSKPQTRKMSFGFHRAEVIGALISVLSIWVTTGILVYMAVQRVIYPNYKINAIIMIYVSIGGIVANLVLGIVFVVSKAERGSDKSIMEKNESINIKSAVIHVLGDLFQSIGVFIASLVIYFKPELKIADPICTFIFSVIVLITTLHILKDIFYVLMEGFPKHLNFSDVRNVLFSVPGVVKIHNLRMWSLTMDKVALSAHIVVCKGENQTKILKNASQIICRNFNIYEVTLQVEEIDDPVNVCSVCA